MWMRHMVPVHDRDVHGILRETGEAVGQQRGDAVEQRDIAANLPDGPPPLFPSGERAAMHGNRLGSVEPPPTRRHLALHSVAVYACGAQLLPGHHSALVSSEPISQLAALA